MVTVRGAAAGGILCRGGTELGDEVGVRDDGIS
jgi:hypothetical protein